MPQHHSIPYALLCIIPAILLLMGKAADAARLNGYAEWNYSNAETEIKSDALRHTRSNTFGQRYSIDAAVNPYTKLSLVGGAIFDRFRTTGSTDSSDIDSTTSNLRPYFDIYLNDPVYTLGAGYSRREETTGSAGNKNITRINEDYHALASWRPEGLPYLDLTYRHNNYFDEERVSQDLSTDMALLSLRYIPVENLDLRYQAGYNDTNNHLKQMETEQVGHLGRVTYSGDFYDHRLTFTTEYIVNAQETTVVTRGDGLVDTPILTMPGLLFALDETPVQGVLSSSDGTALNIGVRGDTTRNLNIGVLLPTAVEMNVIYLRVDRSLPSDISSAFSFDVYVSDNGSDWKLWQAAASTIFGPFQPQFEISFPIVTARYIKLVVAPLSPATALSASPPFINPDGTPIAINVITMSPVIRKPANGKSSDQDSLSHRYTLDGRYRLLEVPALNYEFSLFYARTDPGGATRYDISNGLLLDHRFNDVFSISARVAREDSEEARGEREAWAYSASVRAIPIRTLSHTLVYSGRTETNGGTLTTQSLYLYNAAELYQGFQVSVSGGVSYVDRETGEKDTTYTALFGSSIVPHPKVTLNASYSTEKTTASGKPEGGAAPPSIQRGDLGVTYRPFSNLYLTAVIGFVDQETSPTELIQNYGANWSPFPDGTLLLNFTYNETIRSINDEKSRLFSPTATWKVTARTLLQLAYVVLHSESILETTDSNVFSVNLRTSF